jgi:hypothetical protein
MFDGTEAKETTVTANERSPFASSHDKQCKADSLKHEQSQINGTFLN